MEQRFNLFEGLHTRLLLHRGTEIDRVGAKALGGKMHGKELGEGEVFRAERSVEEAQTLVERFDDLIAKAKEAKDSRAVRRYTADRDLAQKRLDLASRILEEKSLEFVKNRDLIEIFANLRSGRIGTAELGEIRREGGLFRAELRRLTHGLDQVRGRIYGHRCDAVFGDGSCGVDATAPAYRATATVLAVLDEMRLKVGGLSGFAERFFRYGVLTVMSGTAAGLSADIEDHRKVDGTDELVLWLPAPAGLAAGDTLQVTAGCDKRFSTCKFSRKRILFRYT